MVTFDNYIVLGFMYLFMFLTRKDPILCGVMLWYVAQCTFNLLFSTFGPWFFLTNAFVTLILKFKICNAIQQLGKPSHLESLDIILLSGILLNLLGLFDYWFINSIMEQKYNLISQGLATFTIFEVFVLAALSRDGLSDTITTISNHLERRLFRSDRRTPNLAMVKTKNWK